MTREIMDVKKAFTFDEYGIRSTSARHSTFLAIQGLIRGPTELSMPYKVHEYVPHLTMIASGLPFLSAWDFLYH